MMRLSKDYERILIKSFTFVHLIDSYIDLVTENLSYTYHSNKNLICQSLTFVSVATVKVLELRAKVLLRAPWSFLLGCTISITSNHYCLYNIVYNMLCINSEEPLALCMTLSYVA